MQIPLTEEAKRKTAFITQDETGQFECAMFALMNAPFYFNKLMKKIFGPYGRNLALTYFDDISIHVKSWSDMLEKIEKVLELLSNAGLTLNLKKCEFAMLVVEYLGFVVSGGNICPGRRKLQAILDFPVPSNTLEIRMFLGVASSFRRFVPNFAKIVSLLVGLLKAGRSFQ